MTDIVQKASCSVLYTGLLFVFFNLIGSSACNSDSKGEGKVKNYRTERALTNFPNRTNDSTPGAAKLNESVSVAKPLGAINVSSYGAIGDGKTDDVEAINKAINVAAKTNAAVYFPKGDYAIGEPGIQLKYSNLKLIGASRDEVIIKPIEAISALVTSVGESIENIFIENITFRCESPSGNSTFAILLFGGMKDVRIDRCRFTDVYRSFVRLNNVKRATLTNSIYSNTGEVKNGVFVLVRNCSQVSFTNNILWGYYNGFYVYPQPPNEKAEDIVVTGNTFDGRWYLSQAHLSNQGENVSFTSNSIKDSENDFLEQNSNFSRRVNAQNVAEWRLVRVFSPRGGGSAQISDQLVVDTKAEFLKWGTIPGEIIEVGKKRGLIEKVISETELAVEFWYDKYDSSQAPGPSSRSNYKILALYLGKITGFSSHSVQVSYWHDLNGKILTPPNNGRYEIIKRVPLYGLYFTKDVRNVTISNNVLLRNYADQIGWQGSNAKIINNYIKDGQDVGITVSNRDLSGSEVRGNHVERQGSCGIYINGNDNKIIDNVVIGPIPTVNLRNDSTLAGIQIMGGFNNSVVNNKINLKNAKNGHGITLSSKVQEFNAVEGNVLENISDERRLNLFEDASNLRNKWQFEPDKGNQRK